MMWCFLVLAALLASVLARGKGTSPRSTPCRVTSSALVLGGAPAALHDREGREFAHEFCSRNRNQHNQNRNTTESTEQKLF